MGFRRKYNYSYLVHVTKSHEALSRDLEAILHFVEASVPSTPAASERKPRRTCNVRASMIRLGFWGFLITNTV